MLSLTAERDFKAAQWRGGGCLGLLVWCFVGLP